MQIHTCVYTYMDYMILMKTVTHGSCGNMNFARRSACNRCNTPKPAHLAGMGGRGRGDRYIFDLYVCM